MQQAT
jgi:putative SOS response-associated peptidase YedK